MQRCLSGICLLALAFVVGCSAPIAKLPETVPFSGTVTLDGEPLAEADVFFTPEVGGDRECAGKNRRRRELCVECRGGYAAEAGRCPGDYKVHISTILPPIITDKDAERPLAAVLPEKVPQKYTLPSTTPLKVTVPADGGEHNLELKSK